MPTIPDEDVLTDDQIKAFDVKYGEDGWSIIQKKNRRDPSKFDFQIAIRRPTQPEYQLWKARSAEKATAPRAQELLVKQILIHPTQEKLNKIVETFLGIYESEGVTKSLQEMLGLSSDEHEKL